MGIDKALRKGVATIDKVTKPLQVVVLHRAWIGSDLSAEAVFDPPSASPANRLDAIVEYNRKLVKNKDNEDVMQYASLTFVDPPAANGAAGRREPIDPRDELTLPDGHIGPIISISGTADPETNLPYALEVSLG